MRLFKEGEINLPYLYYFRNDDSLTNVQRFSFYPQIFIISSSGKFTIDDEEVLRLTDLIKIIDGNNMSMNFENDILKIALDNFDMSYYAILLQ
jgi:hypothetical protein